MNKKITMTKVTSSSVKSIGYDEEAKICAVQFSNGKIYYYLDVPKSVWEEVKNAESIGKAVQAQLAKGGYQFTKD